MFSESHMKNEGEAFLCKIKQRATTPLEMTKWQPPEQQRQNVTEYTLWKVFDIASTF